jgi:hypothetical protein
MSDKNTKIILEALAERIEELKLDVYLKDLRIKELEKQLSEKEVGTSGKED